MNGGGLVVDFSPSDLLERTCGHADKRTSGQADKRIMILAHPNGFDLTALCAGEDRIMVRYDHEATKFSSYVDVVPRHEWDVIPQLLSKPCDEQVYSFQSVLRALDAHVMKAVRTPHLTTPSARQDFCDDVAIWWLYEFFAGRGSDHVVLDPAERERIRGLNVSINQRFAMAPRPRPSRPRR